MTKTLKAFTIAISPVALTVTLWLLGVEGIAAACIALATVALTIVTLMIREVI